MPQMAPINWLLLFIIFSITLIIFNMMNYFIYMPSSPTSENMNFKKSYLNWKW
uniref:ATP synthase complex subunit 8 n=1 Tax=Nevromus exterior TaxID=1569780 RepID=A0A3G1BQK9_9NEOP|nr:ATP synthase F0 subunit 8 [Nevromus exterior]AKA94248.1 ATP synthase F0 subunit 8 [Nevromus exterior]